MFKRIARWVESWGVYVTPFKSADVHAVMTEPGGVYIMAFCQHCRRRCRHKLWLRRVRLVSYERYAYCLGCGVSWRYTGQRLSNRRNLS